MGVGEGEWGWVKVSGGEWGWVHCLIMPVEYLGLVINSIQKVQGILQECKTIFSMKEITV